MTIMLKGTGMLKGASPITVFAAFVVLGLSGGSAFAQEDAAAAAQRPVVHAPPIVVPARPENDTLPKWSEFPAPPTDVPTVAEIAQRVKTQTAASAQLKAEVSRLVWDNTPIEPFAAATRRRLDPAYIQRLDRQLSMQEIEALATELRRRAAPPPMVD